MLRCAFRFYAEYSSRKKLMGKPELGGNYTDSDGISMSADALLILPTRHHDDKIMSQLSA